MNPKTLNTLIWVAIISMLIGMSVMSPAAGFALYILSAVSSVFPAFWGARRIRITGIALLVLSLLLSAATYPKYSGHMKSYKERARNAVETRPAADPARP